MMRGEQQGRAGRRQRCDNIRQLLRAAEQACHRLLTIGAGACCVQNRCFCNPGMLRVFFSGGMGMVGCYGTR
jgi:hypothetical protein